MWDGMLSPFVKNYNGTTPDHGWDQFEVGYERVQDFVYVSVSFDHRDICFEGEDVPSNAKTYIYEIELEPAETLQDLKAKTSKNFHDLMTVLRERATEPLGENDIRRIREKRPPY